MRIYEYLSIGTLCLVPIAPNIGEKINKSLRGSPKSPITNYLSNRKYFTLILVDYETQWFRAAQWTILAEWWTFAKVL